MGKSKQNHQSMIINLIKRISLLPSYRKKSIKTVKGPIPFSAAFCVQFQASAMPQSFFYLLFPSMTILLCAYILAAPTRS